MINKNAKTTRDRKFYKLNVYHRLHRAYAGMQQRSFQKYSNCTFVCFELSLHYTKRYRLQVIEIFHCFSPTHPRPSTRSVYVPPARKNPKRYVFHASSTIYKVCIRLARVARVEHNRHWITCAKKTVNGNAYILKYSLTECNISYK